MRLIQYIAAFIFGGTLGYSIGFIPTLLLVLSAFVYAIIEVKEAK